MGRRHLPFNAEATRTRLATCVDGEWQPSRTWDRDASPRRAVDDAIRIWLAGLPDVAASFARAARANVGTGKALTQGYKDPLRIQSAQHWQMGDDLFHGALAGWLLDGEVPVADVKRALDEFGRTRTIEIMLSSERMDSVALNDYMRVALVAGEYVRALELFEREEKTPVTELRASKARSERTVAALIAHAYVTGGDLHPLIPAVNRLLALQLRFWQDFGDYRTPVVWLLLRHQLEAARATPVTVLEEFRAML